MSEPRPRIDWTATPIVFVDAPTCAYCGSPEYTTQRSVSNGDGSRTKLAICSACSRPFKITIEIPEPGNCVFPIGDTPGVAFNQQEPLQ